MKMTKSNVTFASGKKMNKMTNLSFVRAVTKLHIRVAMDSSSLAKMNNKLSKWAIFIAKDAFIWNRMEPNLMLLNVLCVRELMES